MQTYRLAGPGYWVLTRAGVMYYLLWRFHVEVKVEDRLAAAGLSLKGETQST